MTQQDVVDEVLRENGYTNFEERRFVKSINMNEIMLNSHLGELTIFCDSGENEVLDEIIKICRKIKEKNI